MQITRAQLTTTFLPSTGGLVLQAGEAELGSGVAVPRTSPAISSPIAGPILNPWPDPPPAIQTFGAPGCLSMMKCESGDASYWQTSAETSGALASSGNRSDRS
jgi:hypothetical protein